MNKCDSCKYKEQCLEGEREGTCEEVYKYFEEHNGKE